MDKNLLEALELLKNSKSKKRESGAKRLRKLESINAGFELTQALEKEIKNPRTWSTQYHLILAIGHSKYQDALPLLTDLAKRDFDASILSIGLGDSIFRLSIISKSIAESLNDIYAFDKHKLTHGAFRALALLRLVPDELTIKEIIKRGLNPHAIEDVKEYPNDKRGLRLWVAAASSGWKKEHKSDFLKECKGIKDNLLALAVENSMKNEYVKWNPY